MKPLRSQGSWKERATRAPAVTLCREESHRGRTPEHGAGWPGLLVWPGESLARGPGRVEGEAPWPGSGSQTGPGPAALDPARLGVARCSPDCTLPLTRLSGSLRGSQEAQLPCASLKAEPPTRKVCAPSYPLLIPLSLTSYTLISCTIDEISQQENLLAT